MLVNQHGTETESCLKVVNATSKTIFVGMEGKNVFSWSCICWITLLRMYYSLNTYHFSMHRHLSISFHRKVYKNDVDEKNEHKKMVLKQWICFRLLNATLFQHSVDMWSTSLQSPCGNYSGRIWIQYYHIYFAFHSRCKKRFTFTFHGNWKVIARPGRDLKALF